LEESLRKIRVDKKMDTMLVLGIPRGGVVVADILASKLTSSSYKCDFDVIIPRKLTAPGNQEIAIGAIMADDQNGGSSVVYFNNELINDLEIGLDHLKKEKTRQLEEIKRRRVLYRNIENKNYDLHDRIVILVDDGAATGATIIAAARWINTKNPKKLVIAIPVSSKDTAEFLKGESDLIVTGTTPSESTFKSVAQYYLDFRPVADGQVIEICRKRGLLRA
jgi:predicted phosphoribosyltransferase